MPEQRRPWRPLLWPRSVRSRATVAVACAASFALAACSVVLMYAVHTNLVNSAQTTALDHIEKAASQLADGAAPTSVVAAAPDVTVTSAPPTTGLESTTGLPPTTRSANTAASTEVGTASGPFLVEAYPDLAPAHTAVIALTWALVPCTALLTLLIACLTWYAMGRALRPVEEIRAEFAEITAHSLQNRVPVPDSGDEVASLAQTMNGTLDQLQRAVARLRTFTSDASHELRGPLTTLRTRLELALARRDGAEWTAVGDESLRDAMRLEEIVADLLLLARLDARQPLKLQPLHVDELLRRTVAEHYPREPVVLATHSGSHEAVLGSPTALTRLLTNLLDNALRHAHSTVTLDVRSAGRELIVEVVDDGPGIPESDREKVFDRFMRLDNARTPHKGGSGLGLAIARDIATAHGGILTAQRPRADVPGARMVLTLPLPGAAG
ncbi:sensor histidine kinase [Streptomyces mirabilis]|uniref:sensor histidine kinase n=1 Tax=Streptomyces mirabilis TaxID=68239 RepID=UPI003320A76F